MTAEAIGPPEMPLGHTMVKPKSQVELHCSLAGTESLAVDLLAEETGLSKRRVRDAMRKGAVWISQKGSTRRLRREKPLLAGDTLHLYYDERILAETITPPQVIADEGAYSVLYKPYGVRSQGSKWGDHCTVHRWAEQHLLPRRPAFSVHRLDRAATGLIVVAHAKRAAAALAKQFEERAVEKYYRAIVHGRFEQTSEPRLVDAKIDGRDACSRVMFIEYDRDQDRSMLDVLIETGRKHQIRRHLAGIGYAVVGDRLYGSQETVLDLQLTAWYLAFECPKTKEQRAFQLPDELIPSLRAEQPLLQPTPSSPPESNPHRPAEKSL